MGFFVERINAENYSLFDDLLYWREHGQERQPLQAAPAQQICRELQDPNLYVYAARVEKRFIGWIALVYIPKVSRWKGHGHIYVDELWVQPDFRGRGIARALMAQADALQEQRKAVGIRLYVNVENPAAHRFYTRCGYRESGQADFMEK